jgi:metal-responsive CopG/Arc/MetJ family transcriptional regulator
MRTLVEIEERHIRELDRIARNQKQSRSALIREAVSEFLQRRAGERRQDAFGLWQGQNIDAIEHQDKMRQEW